MEAIYIGFDFSMNKPAATILHNKRLHFMIWPIDLDEKKVQMFRQANVFVRSRGLSSVSTKDKNSQIVLEHTTRSVQLANMIVNDIDIFINANKLENLPLYISSEGLSYGSKGDAALNLATYKGVLLGKLYEHYFGRLYGLYTYSPITLKATAACAKKDSMSSKTKMIDAFIKEPITHQFKDALLDGKLLAKTSYIPCVDDIVDSYWALMTMIKKEGFKI